MLNPAGQLFQLKRLFTVLLPSSLSPDSIVTYDFLRNISTVNLLCHYRTYTPFCVGNLLHTLPEMLCGKGF